MSNFLTKEGLAKLKAEYKTLVDEKIPAAIKEINAARSLGDLSENAALDAAQFEHEALTTRKDELERILNDYTLIEDTKRSSKIVNIGDEVEFKYIDDSGLGKYKVLITGASEADPILNKISNDSPLALAILNKKVGENCKFKVKGKKYEVQILDIVDH